MYNMTNSGWLGAGGADLTLIDGSVIGMARPRHGLIVVFGDRHARRSGVQKQA